MKRKSKQGISRKKRVVLSIVIISILAVLSFFVISVERVTSSAMAPTLQSGDVIVAMRWFKVEPNDLVTFQYDDQTLVRRVIGEQGDAIKIETDGTVYVNDEALDEPYVQYKISQDYDTTLYDQVSANRYYVLCDNRENAADSRTTSIGGVSKKQINGKVLCCIWPLTHIAAFV